MDFDSCCSKSKKFIDYSMNRVKFFSVLDFAVFKTCLLSLGILIGAKFSKFFKKFEVLMLIAFIISYAYLVYKIFAKIND